MNEVAAPDADGHALTWAVKASFLAYMNRMRGRITLVRPAYPAAAGFAFPHVPAAYRAGDGGETPDAGERAFGVRELAFAGGVAFSAHGGMLDVTLAEPVLVFDDEGTLLTVADMTLPGGGARAVIATLAGWPPAPADATVALVPLLTEEGSALFNGVYPPGEAMDPLFVPASLLTASTLTTPRSE
jgi:Htaa